MPSLTIAVSPKDSRIVSIPIVAKKRDFKWTVKYMNTNMTEQIAHLVSSYTTELNVSAMIAAETILG